MVLPAFGVSIRRLLRILIGIDCTSFILDCTALPLALFWLTFDRGAALSIFRLEHTSFPLSHKPRCRYKKDRAASCTTRSRHPLLTSALHKAAAARATPFPHPSRSQLTLFRTIDFLQLLQYYCNTTAILLQHAIHYLPAHAALFFNHTFALQEACCTTGSYTLLNTDSLDRGTFHAFMLHEMSCLWSGLASLFGPPA